MYLYVIRFIFLISVNPGFIRRKTKILIGRATLTDSYSSDTNYSVCGVDVSKHKRVRFPTTLGTGLIGSIFVDAAGNVLKDLTVPSLNNKFAEGMVSLSLMFRKELLSFISRSSTMRNLTWLFYLTAIRLRIWNLIGWNMCPV